MSDTVSTLFQGPAHIFTAAVGTTLPGASDVDALLGGSLTDWATIGETTAATEIIDTPNFVMATSQQQLLPIEQAVSSTATTLTTTIREISTQRLADFCRGTGEDGAADGSIPAHSVITPGGIGPVPVISLALVAKRPDFTILWIAERVVYSAAMTIGFDSTKYTEVPVEFKVMAPSSAGPVGGSKTITIVPAS